MSEPGSHGPPRAAAVLAQGIIGGTPIATPAGWRPVESLCEGEAVLTFDGPPRPVRLARHSRIAPTLWPPSLWPVQVPPGALENREPLLLLAGQPVLVETDWAERLNGDPFALLPAAALAGLRGIERRPPAGERLAVALGFAREELVYAAGATLLGCAGVEAPGSVVGAMLARAATARPPMMTMEQACHLVACLVAEEAGARLRALLPRQAARDRGENRP